MAISSSLLFGMEIVLIDCGMRPRASFFLCGLILLGLCTLGWAAIKKPSKFVLGINAGLGRWTSQINKDVLIKPLPSFPLGHAVVVADTDTDVNYHLGFSLMYNFTPKFGLQAEFSRINAEYLILIGLNPQSNTDPSKYDTLSLPWKITTVYINGVFNFRKTKGKVFPFAFFGVGFNILNKTRVSGKYMEIESDSSVDLGLKGGGGLNYYLPGAALGFELRAFILYLTAVGGPSYSYQSYTSPSPGFYGENIVWAVDLGLKYRF
jgi:hypothetical protein